MIFINAFIKNYICAHNNFYFNYNTEYSLKKDKFQQSEWEINSGAKQFENLASVYNMLLDRILKTGVE